MKIAHHMKREDSGLLRSTLELAEWERRAGHDVYIQEPSTGDILYGQNGSPPDIHAIHSQLHPSTYYDRRPKLMYMHGEPLSSVANKVSMKAITDLSHLVAAFICMRREEQPIWESFGKRCHLIPKGVDLEVYKPLVGEEAPTKLSGSPSVLYYENWRGERNPLYLCVAMQKVWTKFPNARLHLFNCRDKKMLDTFRSLYDVGHWWPFLRSISGPTENPVALLNSADIVVSCLHPLYARGVEAFGCGKPFICPGYREPGYPWTCDMETGSMADAIIRCWENYSSLDCRKWAEDKHDIKTSAAMALEIYEKYA